VVSVPDGETVDVAAVSGSLTVVTGQGQILGNIIPGKPLHFALQAGQCVSRPGGALCNAGAAATLNGKPARCANVAKPGSPAVCKAVLIGDSASSSPNCTATSATGVLTQSGGNYFVNGTLVAVPDGFNSSMIGKSVTVSGTAASTTVGGVATCEIQASSVTAGGGTIASTKGVWVVTAGTVAGIGGGIAVGYGVFGTGAASR
jgi:hypothetical protein